jgi:hypothetical protein
MKLEFPGQILEKKYSNVMFHENPSSGEPSCFVRMDGGLDGQRDMAKLIVALRNFANAINKTFLSNSNVRTPILLKIILIETLNIITVAVFTCQEFESKHNSE